MRALLLLLAAAVVSTTAAPALTDAPTIGVLSIPIASPDSPCATFLLHPRSAAVDEATTTTTTTTTASRRSSRVLPPLASCFSAFYVRWLQAAGARPVILPYDAAPSLLDSLLDKVNGVLFTGGSIENLTFSSPYMVAAQRVLARVVEKNDAGVVFPLHGTCQGMQVLSLLAAQNQSVLVENAFDAENYSLPLDLASPGGTASRLVRAMPPAVLATLTAENSTLNLHHDGVPPAAYAENPLFSSFFTLVSTNTDRAGRPFISTMEAARYPITATQWHPERNGNEFRAGMGIDHSAEAVSAMAWLGAYFVGLARQNAQGFDPVADADLLKTVSVYSYPFVGTGDSYTSGYQWVVAQL